jgi:hypothetical protein
MAKILRYTGDLKAFGSTATGTERTVFGSLTQSDILDSNLNTDYFRGWGIIGVNDNPSKQDFNALAFTASQLISYTHQMGVPEWDSLQEYPTAGAVCIYSGTLWSRGASWAVGNKPGVSANWVSHAPTAIPLTAVKETDESVTSSTTLQDDDDLQLTLNANSFYKLEAHLTVFSASANPDFKYRFEFGSVGNWSGLKEDADQSTGFDINQGTNAITKTLSAGVSTTIRINIQMQIGAGTGVFKLGWAQNNSDGTATTVKAGSFMKAEKLA